MIRLQFVYFISLFTFVYVGCGGSSELSNVIIIGSKTALGVIDTLTSDEFPPRGVIASGNTMEDKNITERRFIRAEDTISVNINAEPVKIVKPVYPAAATERYMEGTVWLRLWITKDGIVRRARVEESTDVIFNESALRAGMGSTFSHAVKESRPVDVSVYVPFYFKLNEHE